MYCNHNNKLSYELLLTTTTTTTAAVLLMTGEWRESFDKIRDSLVGAESVSEVMNDNR